MQNIWRQSNRATSLNLTDKELAKSISNRYVDLEKFSQPSSYIEVPRHNKEFDKIHHSSFDTLNKQNFNHVLHYLISSLTNVLFYKNFTETFTSKKSNPTLIKR